ncbi:putative sugar transporter [Rosellinia necatrix]|uniref:Putative sugar transporter n=1 Tax=Rosellinia necatrix TaxID=77044 RepID=A0A1S8AAH3_ROSNE|nr:putative sugar transporter [Rosellinia necatrix]
MAGRHSSPFSRSLHFREHTVPLPHPSHSVEMGMRASSVSAAQYSHNAQRRQRHNNYLAIIESPLARLTDEALEIDVRRFQSDLLPCVAVEMLSRAVQVAKYIRVYDEVARSNNPGAGEYLPVQLTREEKSSLKKERDSLPSQPTMYVVILTVSLAAFLQGFVQSSINGASLFSEEFGLDVMRSTSDRWKLGAVNASPFLFAALVGCWVALPINERFGRRGAMAIAASLILASSLGSAFCKDWKQLFGARVFNGIGMGIKAVSTPILASETAVGYWRGTSILAWQLWVAFGIAVGFGFNLIFYTAPETRTVLMLILGSPFVPSILLLVSLYFCPESPRYYLRRQSAHFNPEKAYYILLKLRGSELLALRDVYLIYKSTEREETSEKPDEEIQGYSPSRGFVSHLRAYVTQYKELFTKRRLRNAVMSSSIVALAQQLCGSKFAEVTEVVAFLVIRRYSNNLAVNVLAFYSGKVKHNCGPARPSSYRIGPQEVYLLKASGLM